MERASCGVEWDCLRKEGVGREERGGCREEDGEGGRSSRKRKREVILEPGENVAERSLSRRSLSNWMKTSRRPLAPRCRPLRRSGKKRSGPQSAAKDRADRVETCRLFSRERAARLLASLHRGPGQDRHAAACTAGMSACQAAFSVLLLLVAAVACGRSSSSPPDNNEDAPLVRTCEEVQMRCAQRKGCGSALHAYLYQCNEVIQAGASQCPVPCQRALAALTSTDEGRGLSDCECGENDVCRKSKLRVEVCREAVEKLTAPGARIPCSVAFWMCEAEPQCGTALAYYYRYCRGAFHGKRCTPRCNNSLAILNRQPRSDTLRSCYCDGSEEFPCQKIRDRTDQLCYGRQEPSTTPKPGSAGTAVHPAGGPQLTVTLLLLVSLATRCGPCSVSEVT